MALEDINRDYLDHDDFAEICAKEEVTNPNDQVALLGYLHDLGIAVFFPEVAMQVLNPAWVTPAICSVLEAPEIRETSGEFDLRTPKAVLGTGGGASRYSAEERRAILEVMKRFDMCYEQPDPGYPGVADMTEFWNENQTGIIIGVVAGVIVLAVGVVTEALGYTARWLWKRRPWSKPVLPSVWSM